MSADFDVIIVGAGPAGLGCALALQACGVRKLLVLDKGAPGASFARWPRQMRLITPSFYSNPFGQTDLNAIHPQTSPADFMHGEHPTGWQYAAYLQAMAGYYQLPVESGVMIHQVKPLREGFQVGTSRGERRSRFVIWAAGEFGSPHDGGIRGAKHGIHNSRITDWGKIRPGEHVVVGGYESGMDAAVNLAWQGCRVHVMSRGEPWHRESRDPSCSLSPHTRDRLREALLEAPGSLRFYKNADIREIRKIRGTYYLVDREDEPFACENRPILCTGFRPALGPVEPWFMQPGGTVSFSEASDESLVTPGLFYSGPSLTHRKQKFCFIYKFRSRFGVVAREIASRLDLPWEEALKPWRDHGFMIDDLSCCEDCRCPVPAGEETLPEPAEFSAPNTNPEALLAPAS